MAYAVFPGDERYHVVKAGKDYTLCGLPALMGWPDGCPSAGMDGKLSALKPQGTHNVRRRHTSC
jgi:hypothetical protein